MLGEALKVLKTLVLAFDFSAPSGRRPEVMLSYKMFLLNMCSIRQVIPNYSAPQRHRDRLPEGQIAQCSGECAPKRPQARYCS
jgi:hypothetical protein